MTAIDEDDPEDDDDNDDDDAADDDDDLCICFRLGKGPTGRIMVGPFRLVVQHRVARKKIDILIERRKKDR